MGTVRIGTSLPFPGYFPDGPECGLDLISDDYLKLSSLVNNADDPGYFLHPVPVHLSFVPELKSKPGCAMGQHYHIIFSANSFQDLQPCFPVIHTNLSSRGTPINP